ncbi:XRE family transcriptional regulator [Shewanella nanhaiensis]|uniref:XRE family transcriptional regulator n=1 Tax=Shewanella nanhaiensis TaxID=2864872 RepID=A0ABS7DY27_9GAMM|nr:XRE family transcriptional regulator [Shewanella nanhaiensis]MBW8182330.1 XRE family transcriptional regulator [Shewanella nanhaiensis]
MELFSLLLKIRNELNFTQAEMVEKLSLYHKVFANLDLITYSRWERGVSMPSSLRIIHLLSFAQYDVMRYLIKLDLKLSKTKSNLMTRLEAHAYDQQALIQTAYYTDVGGVFNTYSGSNPLTDLDRLEKICESSGRFFKLEQIELEERCRRSIELQKSGALHIVTCEGQDERMYAHALISVHNLSERDRLRSQFKDFYDIPRDAKICGEKVVFVHSVMRFNFQWWEYNCFQLLKVLFNDPEIKELFLIVRDKNAEQLYSSFGFKVEVEADMESESPFASIPKLISIERDDFLSHHGVIAWLKSHADLIKH